ncbi:SusD/RagB family nutrient-binding outer membrane lipoprotein [Sphingobacterium haloxyli]|uniref:SusD/RagB family nutrient-binding outer membrane lipoprotein n=1 Tax=Sphingobacterium haloxyli TaxID=2100533 RepID=A0A2S9J944_9SPHI|nr:SusD/RagB family nutrient-binding outer membrane lipoprotein [Sphingobacterium haloxyli]PRD49313.1 SusD/RagB family nutrient-binding outer membrane lipoprotein [Sphingobacterium haloxyli]
MKKTFIFKTIYFLAMGLASMVLSISCNKGFQELNTNPNTSPKVQPENLLAPAITKSVSYGMSRAQRVTNELMQVTVNMGDGEGRIFRYDIRETEAVYLWNNLYLQLRNFRDVYEFGEELNQPEYMGIAQICEAWLFSILTDTYGDIPFSEALRGKDLNNFTPAFDKQEDIYPALFEKLEEANELLGGLAPDFKISENADPIFGGNIRKWRQFGNSLYLRLALRLSHKTELNTSAIITKIVDQAPLDYPIMISNDDSAILRWTGSAPYVSPFATWRPADWYAPKSASFFVDNLNERSDPRIKTWLALAGGDYFGVPSGYPIGQPPVAGSTLHTGLLSHPLMGNILNYGELQFILAEAAVKGWVSAKPAQTYYEEGIISSIHLWNHEVPPFYLTTELTAWDDGYSEYEKMELIHLQKYYALFFTDLQSWFEYRRTGHPTLPIGPGHLNDGKMPARLIYPVYVQTANRDNYQKAVTEQGPDNINTLVWWQRP